MQLQLATQDIAGCNAFESNGEGLASVGHEAGAGTGEETPLPQTSHCSGVRVALDAECYNVHEAKQRQSSTNIIQEVSRGQENRT